MLGASSSSSSSEDEVPTKKSKDDSCSDSNFESRSISKDANPSKTNTTASIASPSPKAKTNVNTNLLAIAKGNSQDFMTKMNAATQRNFPLKSPAPWKKLTKIGFDNDQTDSSDNNNKKSLTKDSTQITSTSKHSTSETSDSDSDEEKSKPHFTVKTSPVKSILTNKNDSLSSDSESDTKKKALLQKRQESKAKLSSDSESDTSDSGKQVSFSESPTKKSPAMNSIQSAATSKIGNAVKISPVKTVSALKKDLSSSDSDEESDMRKTALIQKLRDSKRNQTSASDSDSVDDIDEQIEKIKRELKQVQTSRNRQTSSSDDSDSSSTEEVASKKMEANSSNNASLNKTGSDSIDDNDDLKMTSLLTQRNTPAKNANVDSSSEAESKSSSDQNTSTNELRVSSSSRKPEKDSESETEENCLISRDKLFSKFLSNSDYREVKIKSPFDTEKISKDDEIYICSVPKQIPPNLLHNKEISLDNSTTISFGMDKYDIKSRTFKSKKRSLCLINRHKNTTFLNFVLAGQIKVLKTSAKVQIDKQINLKGAASDKRVAVPKLTQRHPLFGSDLSKVILSEAVQNRLDSMIEDLNKKINNSKRKKAKSGNETEDCSQIVKEDVYKIVNFLQKTSGGADEINKVANIKKSKKKSSKNEEVNEPQIFTVTVNDSKNQYNNYESAPSKKSKIPETNTTNDVVKVKKSKKKTSKTDEIIEPQMPTVANDNKNQFANYESITEPPSKKSKKKASKTEEIIEPQMFAAVKYSKNQPANYESFTEPLSKKSNIPEQDNASPKKNKKSKLKPNLPLQDEPKLTFDNVGIGLDINKPGKGNNDKSKKKKNVMLANSTFASPSVSAKPTLFKTNESIIPAESSKSLKHIKKAAKRKIVEDSYTAGLIDTNEPKISLEESLHLINLEEIIKKVGKRKNDDSNFSNTETEHIDSRNIEETVSLPKKKKKKKKDDSSWTF